MSTIDRTLPGFELQWLSDLPNSRPTPKFYCHSLIWRPVLQFEVKGCFYTKIVIIVLETFLCYYFQSSYVFNLFSLSRPFLIKSNSSHQEQIPNIEVQTIARLSSLLPTCTSSGRPITQSPVLCQTHEAALIVTAQGQVVAFVLLIPNTLHVSAVSPPRNVPR